MYQCPRTFFLERGVPWCVSWTTIHPLLAQESASPRYTLSYENVQGHLGRRHIVKASFRASISYEATATARGATASFSATEKQPARDQTGSAVNTETGSQVPGLRELNETSTPLPVFVNFKEPRNQFQGTIPRNRFHQPTVCSLPGRYVE